jgi:dihydropteroate synthase
MTHTDQPGAADASAGLFPGRPCVVIGILNVTPNSFSDGGWYLDPAHARERALQMKEEGADVIDIGGESTRPGAAPVSAEEECRRVLPVIEAVAKEVQLPLSIDSTKYEVVSRAFDAGATWINDISGGCFDTRIPEFAGTNGATVIVMHSRETPATMQQHPHYDDVRSEVIDELAQSVERYRRCGVCAGHILVDPGIGFAKRMEDNLSLLAHMKDVRAMGYDVCLGTSRKSFIGTITGMDTAHRVYGSLASIAQAFLDGVRFFRVHDVAATKQFLNVMHAVRTAT